MATDFYSMLGEFSYTAMPHPLLLAFVIYIIYAYMIWKNNVSQSSALPIILFLTFILSFGIPDPQNVLYKVYVLAAIAQGTVIGLGVLSIVGKQE